MSVTDPKVIDLIGVDKASGEVILTISDHLDWSDTKDHQLALQEKLNTYLAFVESNELLERYPDASGRPVVFNVALKFRPNRKGLQSLTRARAVIESAGFRLRFEVFSESYDN